MKRIGVLAFIAALSACTAQRPALAPIPAAPAASPYFTIVSTPVPLNPDDPAQTSIGDFHYAGGVVLTSAETDRLHGLSDLRILPDHTIVAVTDEVGEVFTGRLMLDDQDRLVGVDRGEITPLRDLAGAPITDKAWGDAEGLAILANGDRLVSFERNHRIWRYRSGGGAAVAAPSPATIFPENEGMEALSDYPAAGPDAYLVGGEEGEMWLCRLSAACQSIKAQPQYDLAYGLVAVAPFDGPMVTIVHRAWDAVRGVRLIVSVLDDPRAKSPRVVGRLTLQHPLTRDNFEGLAVVRNAAGGARFYLVSDDNASATQRTILMAFDWKPTAPPPAPPMPVKKPAVKKRR